MMRQKARQYLENQLQRLEEQRDDTKRKLRALARQTRREQWYQCGKLVELAGLKEADHGLLLGGLCELATMVTDHDVASRWKATGDAMLAAHRQRTAHRKRGAAFPVDNVTLRVVPKANETGQT